METWYEIDLRSKETGDSVETICSTTDHDEACRVLDQWCLDNCDGSADVFADIYYTDDPHGLGKWG